jgi:hypothetical protein
MQLTDDNNKVVFKASVNVAVDDYINNIPLDVYREVLQLIGLRHLAF